MSIPQGITRQHILTAKKRLDEGELTKFSSSTKFDVVIDENRYPPKAILSIAAEEATGIPLPVSAFNVGEGDGESNSVLRKLGFTLVEKESVLPDKRSSRFDYLLTILEYVSRRTNTSTKDIKKHVSEAVIPMMKQTGYSKENFDEAFNKRQIGVIRSEFYDAVLQATRGHKDRLREIVAVSPGYRRRVGTSSWNEFETMLQQLTAACRPNWLLTFNPQTKSKRHDFSEQDWANIVGKVASKGDFSDVWSTGGSTNLYHNDTAYILRQGPQYRGIVGFGKVKSHVYPDKNNRKVVKLTIKWATEKPLEELSLECLQEKFPDYHWTPQGSGNGVPDDISDYITSIIFNKSEEASSEEAAIVPMKSIPKQVKRLKSYLLNKRQIILSGPPGTGKTRFAKQLAIHLCLGDDDNGWVENTDDIDGFHNRLEEKNRVKIIVFHPSYEYSTFIGGMAINDESGSEKPFVEKDGVFITIANLARENKDLPFVLIIDEINRGNLPKLFGELIYGLEYRNSSIQLSYNGWKKSQSSWRAFQIPNNLYIIGTMNSADQSIAPLDVAVRRRFGFSRIVPDAGIISTMTSIDENEKKLRMSVMEKLNDALSTEHREFTIGHSYFLQEKMEEVWTYELQPLLFEYQYRLGLDQDHIVSQVSQCLEWSEANVLLSKGDA